MLDDNTLKRLRAKLDAREAELQSEVRAVNEESADTPSSVTLSQVEDLAEQGEQRTRGAVRYAEKERDIAELREIEAARERMAAGTYGLCVDCGRDIAPERLEVQPAALRCLQCQERYERGRPPTPHISPVL